MLQTQDLRVGQADKPCIRLIQENLIENSVQNCLLYILLAQNLQPTPNNYMFVLKSTYILNMLYNITILEPSIFLHYDHMTMIVLYDCKVMLDPISKSPSVMECLNTNNFYFILFFLTDFLFLLFFFQIIKRHMTPQSHNRSHGMTSQARNMVEGSGRWCQSIQYTHDGLE